MVQKAIRDYNSQMKSAREDGRLDALRELAEEWKKKQ